MSEKLKLEIKDILMLGSVLVSIVFGYAAFDRRLSLTEQKLDAVVRIVESVQRFAMDHEKRIIVLEQKVK